MILDQLLQWHLDLIGGHDHDFVAVVVADDAGEDDVVWEQVGHKDSQLGSKVCQQCLFQD